VNGLYRSRSYAGDWEDNERTGKGLLTMIDGMRLEGSFEKGVLNGEASCGFFLLQ